MEEIRRCLAYLLLLAASPLANAFGNVSHVLSRHNEGLLDVLDARLDGDLGDHQRRIQQEDWFH